MSQVTIRAESLSKMFRLGVTSNSHPTLRDALLAGARRLRGRPAAGVAGAAPAACNEYWALREVSFEVRTGEVLGIIGPNGAGKSTVLKILSRIVEPTSGRAEVHGRLGALLEVGTGFHPELTGRENIFLNGAILGMRRAEIMAKLDEIVEFAGISGFLDTPLKRYSSGMYLRLAFAVAAHVDPDILIVDEVLAVGDAAFQKRCITKAESIAGAGRTVLFVSHQMSVVQRLCTRSILIEGGRVRADGPTAEVVRGYLQTLETRAQTDLGQRTDRIGRGLMRVVGIEIVGDGGPLSSGAPAVIRIPVEGPRRHTQCMLTILNDLGDPVTAFDTSDGSAHDGKGNAFAVHVGSLLLRPGRYRVDVALIGEDRVVEDHVETAAVFDVQPGMIWDRPVAAAPGYGSISLPHRWTIRR